MLKGFDRKYHQALEENIRKMTSNLPKNAAAPSFFLIWGLRGLYSGFGGLFVVWGFIGKYPGLEVYLG